MKHRFLRAALCAALLCLLLLACALPALAEEADEAAPPAITSGSSIVVYNVETDTLLYDNDGARSVAPTVVSKLMTAMIAFDHYASLTDKVTVAAEALRDIGAAGDISAPRLGLSAGSEMTVEDLLCATLVSSANDAACALAYDVSGGDIAAFVEEMNRRAAALGAADTHFTSPAGVYSAQSHTTARDAARIAGAFYNYGRLLEISSLPYYQLGNTMHTKNYLLSEALMKGCTLAGAKGIAAGQAKADGQYCLITGAEAEALTYIFVVMDAAGENRYNDGTRDFPAENAYNDVKKLFPWATSAFGYSMLLSAEDVVGELPVRLSADADFVTVVPAEPIEVLLPKSTDLSGVERRIEYTATELEAPVAKGTVVGSVSVWLDGQELGSTELVTRLSVEKSELLSIFDKVKSFLYGDTMKTIIRILLVIIALFIVYEVAFFIRRLVKRAKGGK